MRLYVPYARSGPRPRVVRLGDLGCACSGSSSSGLGRLGADASWQTNPQALKRLANAATAGAKRAIAHSNAVLGLSGALGSLGLSPETSTVVGAVGSKVGAAGASAAATALGAGAIAGPIGIAAGAVIAIALTLFRKNYFDVASSNAACVQQQALWQKYLTIQGHVAGRALGWPTMQVLMHAATGAGLFPGNDMHLSFHNGTLECAGHGDWVDEFLSNGDGPACGAHNCMADALAAFEQKRSSLAPGTPDAVFFVDNILLPMNASASIPWISNGARNAQVHQMLYDLADAYLAQGTSGTTPYVEFPAAQVAGEVTAGAEGAPVAAAAPAAAAPAAAAQSPAATYQPVDHFGNAIGPPLPVGAAPPMGSTAYVAPAQVPSSVAVTTATGAAGTVSSADLASLTQAMLAQGQSATQAYNSALAALQSQGVNTNNSQLQSALAQLAQSQTPAPAPAAAPVAAQAGFSTIEIVLLVGVGVSLLFGMRGKGASA